MALLSTNSSIEDGEQSTTPSDIETAASKVFSTFELLEMILIHESDTAIEGIVPERFRGGDPGYKFYYPAQGLFILQRTNKFFQATIARSKLLQRRMFLAEDTELDEGKPVYPDRYETPIYYPLFWMSHRLEQSDHHNFSFDDPHTFIDFEMTFNLRLLWSQDGDELSARIGDPWTRREASWRKMKAFRMNISSHEEVPKMITCSVGPLRYFEGSDQKSWEIREKDDLTLGRFADWFDRIAELQLSYYAARYEARRKGIPYLELQGPIIDEIDQLKF